MKRLLRENWMLVIMVLLIAGGYAFLRTPGDSLASTAEFDAQATDGTPLVVVFYSNT